jgi:hypothetical protein
MCEEMYGFRQKHIDMSRRVRNQVCLDLDTHKCGLSEDALNWIGVGTGLIRPQSSRAAARRRPVAYSAFGQFADDNIYSEWVEC